MALYKKININKIKTTSLKKRNCKVSIKDFSRIMSKKDTFRNFTDSLPNILKADDLRYLVDKIIQAKKKKKMVMIMMGRTWTMPMPL